MKRASFVLLFPMWEINTSAMPSTTFCGTYHHRRPHPVLEGLHYAPDHRERVRPSCHSTEHGAHGAVDDGVSAGFSLPKPGEVQLGVLLMLEVLVWRPLASQWRKARPKEAQPPCGVCSSVLIKLGSCPYDGEVRQGAEHIRRVIAVAVLIAQDGRAVQQASIFTKVAPRLSTRCYGAIPAGARSNPGNV
eukprot:scaffold3096_cov403-Prasinococcus_capsulatus_cf.AAC.10